MKKNSEESICGRTQQQRGNLSSHHFQQQECFPQRNQRWFHLPVSICEALRAFGAEFSCLFPCRSSSSCSLPAAVAAASMAAMIEQKLVNAVAYEPFVLTRCKSEPMRTAAAKLMPEACFWKNRKLEPHRNANFGVGAAGVGF